MDKNKKNMLIGAGVCIAFAGSYYLYKKCGKKNESSNTLIKLTDDTIKSHLNFVTTKNQDIRVLFGKHISKDTFVYVSEAGGELKLSVLNIKDNSISLASEVLDKENMKFGIVRMDHNDKVKSFYTITDIEGILSANVYSYVNKKIGVNTYTQKESTVDRGDDMYKLVNPVYHGGYLHPYEYNGEDKYIMNDELIALTDNDELNNYL